MSETSGTWTNSQKQAFSYIRKGVRIGLSATSALKEYRSGGGAIRDAYWYSLYKETTNKEGWKDSIFKLPTTYIVRENMFLDTDWDFREKYIMQMDVGGYSEELGQRVRKWVTVESDKLITKQEWRWAAQQAIYDTIGSIPFVVDTFYEYAPLIRVR